MNLKCKTQIKWIFSSYTLHGDLKRRNSSILSLFWLSNLWNSTFKGLAYLPECWYDHVCLRNLFRDIRATSPPFLRKFNGLQPYHSVCWVKTLENRFFVPNFHLCVDFEVNTCWPQKLSHQKLWNLEIIFHIYNIPISSIDLNIFYIFCKK